MLITLDAALYSGKSPEQILQLTRRLLDDQSRWTKNAKARDANNSVVHPGDPTAVCWCVEGAVGLLANKNAIVPFPLLELLDKVCIELFTDQIQISHLDERYKEAEPPLWPYVAYEGVGYVNDVLGHSAILLVLDRAIELSKTR